MWLGVSAPTAGRVIGGKSPEDSAAMLKADYQATAKLAARIALKVD